MLLEPTKNPFILNRDKIPESSFSVVGRTAGAEWGQESTAEIYTSKFCVLTSYYLWCLYSHAVGRCTHFPVVSVGIMACTSPLFIVLISCGEHWDITFLWFHRVTSLALPLDLCMYSTSPRSSICMWQGRTISDELIMPILIWWCPI